MISIEEMRHVYFIYEGFVFLESPWFSQAHNLQLEINRAKNCKSLKKAPFPKRVLERGTVAKNGAGEL